MNNFQNLKDRLKLISDIKETENIGRKAESLRQVEIFNDRIFNHVYERLTRRFERNTVLEMPIVSSVNLARRIVKQEASIYRNPPKREWSGELSDEQLEVIDRIYRDMNINSKMMKSNESFKLQSQNHIYIVPTDGKLEMRVMRNHHLDSIDSDDPEKPLGYVINSLNKNKLLRNRKADWGGAAGISRFDSYTDRDSNFKDSSIGDDDDFEKTLERYLIWTPEYNFLMNGKGEILSDNINNDFGMVPFIDISSEKDFEYWVRQGDSLSEFTVDYNSYLSDASQVVMMQGYSQAYMIADDSMMPENIKIGPQFVLRMPINPSTEQRPEFGYSSTGADLNGVIEFGNLLLSNFLTSRGLDASVVSGRGESNKASSGIERYLRMIEKFEASKSDYDIYQSAEQKVWDIVKNYHNLSLGTDLLDRKYQTKAFPEDSQVMVQFSGPEMVKSDDEKVETWIKRIEQGEATVIDMIKDLRGVDRQMAEEIALDNLSIERRLVDANRSEHSDSGDRT